MPKQTRRVLKINQANLVKHLKVIATHGLNEQGGEKALQIAKELFYFKKGRETLPLSIQEVGKIIFH